MLEILQKAILAQKRQHWSIVDQYLTQLLINDQESNTKVWEEAQYQEILDLCLEIVIRGDLKQGQAIAQIFVKLGQPVLAPLLKLTEHPLPQVRAIAILALSKYEQEEILAVLFKALQDQAIVVRLEAAIAVRAKIERYPPQELISACKILLNDVEPKICQQAALILGDIGTNEAADMLFPVLKSPATPVWFKLELVQALAKIKTLEALDYLEQALKWTNEAVCLEIIAVLGHQKHPHLKERAIVILLDFLHSGQEAATKLPIQQAVALSLQSLVTG